MAWYMLGQSFEQESETAKALAAWRSAIAIDPNFTQAPLSLAHALRSTNQAESERLMTRYLAVQKRRSILDRSDTLSNNGIEAASAHDWPAATRQLNEAIAACGGCAARASLHRKLASSTARLETLPTAKRNCWKRRSSSRMDPITQAALEASRPGSKPGPQIRYRQDALAPAVSFSSIYE